MLTKWALAMTLLRECNEIQTLTWDSAWYHAERSQTQYKLVLTSNWSRVALPQRADPTTQCWMGTASYVLVQAYLRICHQLVLLLLAALEHLKQQLWDAPAPGR